LLNNFNITPVSVDTINKKYLLLYSNNFPLFLPLGQVTSYLLGFGLQSLLNLLKTLYNWQSSHELHLVKTNKLNFTAFCDADWGGDTIDRKSTCAYIVYVGPNIISWSWKKQSTVARPSTEAEYRTIATTTVEIIWIRQLLHELGLVFNQPHTIFSDNIGATYFCVNPVFHSRMKHLAIDYHFVRDLVAANQLQVSHIPSSHQLVDLLTKPLSSSRHNF
jgi:hypothetical protein